MQIWHLVSGIWYQVSRIKYYAFKVRVFLNAASLCCGFTCFLKEHISKLFQFFYQMNHYS